jgi:hypothetical protein
MRVKQLGTREVQAVPTVRGPDGSSSAPASPQVLTSLTLNECRVSSVQNSNVVSIALLNYTVQILA